MWENPFQTEGERAELVEHLLSRTVDLHEREVLETVLQDSLGRFHVHNDGRIQHVKWLARQECGLIVGCWRGGEKRVFEFALRPSYRKCYLGHIDVFEVEGTDDQSRAWLGDWDMWCRTCEALVVDDQALGVERESASREGVVGYVISVPVLLLIREAQQYLTAGLADRVAEVLRTVEGLQRKGESNHGD